MKNQTMAVPMAEKASSPNAEADLSLGELFHRQLAIGRFVLVVAAAGAALLSCSTGKLSSPALLVQILFLLYCVATFALVRRAAVARLPLCGLLVLDSLWLALVAYHTGGSESPFLGLYYLIVLAAALLFGWAGGCMAGVVAALTATLLGYVHHAANWPATFRDLRNVALYYVVVGGFTGFLVNQVRSWFRQFQESQADVQARIVREQLEQRELELARRIQTAALPIAPPEVPGLDVAVRLEFAREVGGDFYLFLPGQERIGLVVGDVSGKGIPAALLSTTIAYLFPEMAPLLDPPGAIRSLNLALQERLPAAAFVSLVFAVVEQEANRVRLWNAGHPPPLLWQARDRRVKEGEIFNRVLGVALEGAYHLEEWPFQDDDVLLLFSDGLPEVRNAREELFHSSRAAAVLAENAERSSEQIADALVAAARSWGTLTDDLTLVVCKRLPVPARAMAVSQHISAYGSNPSDSLVNSSE